MGEILRTFKGHTGPVYSVCYSPDGKYIVSGSKDKTIRIWRMEDGECIMVLKGHTGSVYSVFYSPDGKHITSGSKDKTIRIWKVEDGKCTMILKGHSHSVLSACYSPDGEYIASGSQDETVRIWRPKGKWRKCIRVLTRWEKVRLVCYSPDGKYLASGIGSDIKIWRVEDGKCVKLLKGHTGPVYSACYSPDGKYITSGSQDKTVRIWRMEDGKCIKILKGHTESVNSVCYSPDGKYVASGSDDETVRIWRVEDGECVMVLKETMCYKTAESARDKYEKYGFSEGQKKNPPLESLNDWHTDWVHSVCYSPDGRYIAFSSGDDIVIFNLALWKEEIERLIDEEKYDEAMNLIVQVESKDYWCRIIEALIGKRKYHEALDAIKRGQFPEWEKYWHQIVQNLIKEAKYHDALKLVAQKSKENWQKKEYLYCFEIYLNLGTFDLAYEILEELGSKTGKVFAELYYRLALACEQNGKLEKAISIYKEIIDKFTTYKDVINRYKNLREMMEKEKASPAPERPPIPKPKETVLVEEEVVGLISGRYELLKEIGQGGMGIVYEAMDHRLKRKVAIKKMREEIKAKPKERERFLKEARTVAKLHHPNIVDIYDVIEEEGEIYLVFEFVQGKTLEDIIGDRGKVSWEKSRDIAVAVCDALEYAHKQRVIHRDLKPSNIMLTDAGHVKVMDFGIAREAKDTVSRLSGETSGTLVYMAPEQHLGSYDERTDIFSLGATMYEM
ncbi:MAG: hypothetical protein DRN88_05875, partial [Candidatus Hydrothermarchaeota archaeon]